MMKHRSSAGIVVAVVVLAVTAWSPSAAAKAPGANGQVAFDTADGTVWVVGADGSAPTQLQINVDGSAVPRWSPDGSRLLIATFTDLGLRPGIVNPDGSGLTVLSVPGLPSYVDISPCVWVPSGTRILCKAQNFATSDHSLDGIYSMNTEGTDLRRLTVNPFPPADPFGGGDLPGDVSPSGTQFVFMRARPDPGHSPGREQSGALYVENIDGTGLHQITQYGLPNSHDDGFESWSPDGSEILFASENGNLFTVHPDGTALASVPIRAAAGQSFARAPAWSPDGTRIVTRLYLGAVGQAAIYTLRSNGTDLTPISPPGLNFVNDPDWGASSTTG